MSDTRVDSGALRLRAKAIRDKALAEAANARTPNDPDSWLAWNEARHQAWMTYARTVLVISEVQP